MKQSLIFRNKYFVVAAFFVLVLSLTLMGCSGSSGSSGSAASAPAAASDTTVSGGTVSGTVTTSTGKALANITVNAYLTTAGTAASYKQLTPNQAYVQAKAMLASTNPVIASATTSSSGTYSLSLSQGVYAIVFTDPLGNFTLATYNNEVVANGVSTTVNATMGEASAAEPSVTVASLYPTQTVGSSSSSVNPLSLYSTDEVGYGGTVDFSAQGTSPISTTATGLTPVISYSWTAAYSVNPGTINTSGTAITPTLSNTTGAAANVTLPSIAQSLAGVPDANFAGTGTDACAAGALYISTVNSSLNAGTFGSTAGCYDVTPFVPSTSLGVLPIMADTRGTVSTTVTVTDGLGGSTSVSITSWAAGTQTGLNDVPVGEPVYVNSGKFNSTSATSWKLVSTPSGSKATIANPTWPITAFIPDVQGAYVVQDTANTAAANSITIYAGTWSGVITGGGVTSVTVPPAPSASAPSIAFTTFTTPAGGTSTLYGSGTWGSPGSYTDFPYVMPNALCLDCHSSSSPYTTAGLNGFTLTATDNFTPWTGTAHATVFARVINNGIDGFTESNECMPCHTVGGDNSLGAVASMGFSYVAMSHGFSYPAIGSSNWTNMLKNYPAVAQLVNVQCENCHGPQNGPSGATAHESGLAGTATIAGGTRVSYSSEDCGICHAEGIFHHNYSEWLATPIPPTPGSTIVINATPTTPAYTFTITAGSSGAGHAHSQNETGNGCERCHYSEGFAAYVNQIKQYTNHQQLPSVAGTFEPQYIPSSVTGTALSPTYAWGSNGHPIQTCTACHDPHNDSNPYQLRVYNSTPTGMQGHGVSGLGAGAICTVCHAIVDAGGVECDAAHLPIATGAVVSGTFVPAGTCQPGSTLSGPTFLHEDIDPTNGVNAPSGYPKYPAGTLTDLPWMSSSSDVLVGHNAFFMGDSLPMVSPHASIQDACAGCHMALNPSTHSGEADTHVFYITDKERPTVCANCHGGSTDAVNGLGLVTATKNSLMQLWSAIGTGVKTALQTKLYPNGGTIYVGTIPTGTSATSNVVAINTAQITAVTLANIWQGASTLPFFAAATPTTPTISHSAALYFYTSAVNATTGLAASNYVAEGSLTQIYTSAAGTTPVFSPNGIFRRALWNGAFISIDYSNGIHNPAFVTAVLANTINAVTTLNYIDPNTGLPLVP